MSKRLSWHKDDARRKAPQGKLYTYMTEIGVENFRLVLIQELKLENKEQLKRAEDAEIQKISIIVIAFIVLELF